jgi:hypothetical protein
MISPKTLELRTKVYNAYGGVCVECGDDVAMEDLSAWRCTDILRPKASVSKS